MINTVFGMFKAYEPKLRQKIVGSSFRMMSFGVICVFGFSAGATDYFSYDNKGSLNLNKGEERSFGEVTLTRTLKTNGTRVDVNNTAVYVKYKVPSDTPLQLTYSGSCNGNGMLQVALYTKEPRGPGFEGRRTYNWVTLDSEWRTTWIPYPKASMPSYDYGAEYWLVLSYYQSTGPGSCKVQFKIQYPSAPQYGVKNLKASYDESAKKVIVTWDSHPQATHYEIERWDSGSQKFTELNTNWTDTRFEDNDLLRGKVCRYRISAVNEYGYYMETSNDVSIPSGDQPSEYTITVAAGGGTGGGRVTYTKSLSTQYKTITPPTKDGSIISSWTVGTGWSGTKPTVEETSTGYRVKIPANTSGSFTITPTWEEISGSPPNDNFGSATEISGDSGSVSGLNVGATQELLESWFIMFLPSTTTVWWKWTAPENGSVAFDTANSLFNTQIGVYTGAWSLSSELSMLAKDEGGNGRTGSCTFECAKGTTYYICVGGYQNASGKIKLNWNLTATYEITISAGSGGTGGSMERYTKSAAIQYVPFSTPKKEGYDISSWTVGTGWSGTKPTVEETSTGYRVKIPGNTTGSFKITPTWEKGAEPQVEPPTAAEVSIKTYGAGANTEYIEVKWSGGTGATSYDLYRSTSSSEIGMRIKEGASSPYKDYKSTSNLVPGKKYHYSVKSINSAGTAHSQSDWGTILVSLSLDTPTKPIDADGGTGSSAVTANTSWSAEVEEGKDWISLAAKAGDGNGMVSYLVDANPESAERTCTITVTAGMGTSYPATQKITVTQAAKFADPDFEIDSGTLVKYKGLGGDVVIPSTVVGIGGGAFAYCSDVTSVTIPSSVEVVGYRAFACCTGLKSITIPSTVAYIGSSAFSGCSSLTNMVLPFVGSQRGNSGTEDSLFGFVFGSSKYDGASAVSQHYADDSFVEYYIPTSLTSVRITDETSIGYGAFYGCNGLDSVEMTSTVTNIGCYAFYQTFHSLLFLGDGKSVSIPASVVSVGDYAFAECNALTAVEISQGVAHIGNYAFYKCANLSVVEIPSSVENAGDYAFSECGSLASVEISRGVKSLGNAVFLNCYGLSSLEIPSSVTEIGVAAFGYCRGLQGIAVDDENVTYCSRNGILYDKDCRVLVSCPGAIVSVTMPSSVVGIGDSAFVGCSKLTSVEMSSNLSSIGKGAFWWCSALTSVDIPSSVASIGESAFEHCAALADVRISEGVRSIGAMAFASCNGLTMIAIPSSVTSIGDNAFYDCAKLAEINVDDANAIYSSHDGILCDKDRRVIICCPEGHCDEVKIPSGVISIGTSAFEGCDKLRSIEVPGCVEDINDRAFYDCGGLISVVLSEGTKSIGTRAFAYCKEMTSIAIPSTVTSISESVFYGCKKLATIYVDVGDVQRVKGLLSDCGVNLGSISFLERYKITYLPGDFGDGCSVVSNKLEGVPVTLAGELFSRIGYTQTGWSKNPNGSPKAYDLNDSCAVDEEVTFYPYWTANSYEITYVLNGGTYGSSHPESATYGQPFSVSAPTCLGYTFTGWTVTIGLDTSTAKWGTGSNPTEPLTSPVTTCANGATGSVWFKNLTPVAGGKVTLAANWEKNELSDFVIENGVLTEYVGVGGDVTVPAGVTSIGWQAFSGCSALTSVILPDGVKSIGNYAFYNCSGLKSIDFPDGLTSIGDDAFYACISLASAKIPSSVTSIGDWAFYRCEELTSLTIPASVTSIGDKAFLLCRKLKEILVETDNETYASIDGILYDKATSQLLQCPAGRTASVTIPSGTPSVGEWAFYSCMGLTSVMIEPGLTSVGESAFAFCSGLTSVTIPSGVTNIASKAFYYCSKIESMTLPSSLESIGEDAFASCNKLKVVYVPSGYAGRFTDLYPFDAFVEIVEMDEPDVLPDLSTEWMRVGWAAPVFLSDSPANSNAVHNFSEGNPIYLFNLVRNAGEGDVKGEYDVLHEVVSANGDCVASYTNKFYDGLLAGSSIRWEGSRFTILQGLAAGEYTYRCTLDSRQLVDEIDESNNVCTYSFTVSANIVEPPSVPSLSVTTWGAVYSNTSHVEVSWSGGVGATSFNLYRSTSDDFPSTSKPLATFKMSSEVTAGSSFRYLDNLSSGLIPGVRYYYWIVAVNSEGAKTSNSDWGNILASLSFDETSASYTAEGGQGRVLIAANTLWSAVVDVPWITLVTKTGSGGYWLIYKVAANSGSNDQFGTITVTAGAGTAYPVVRTFTVKIEAAVSPIPPLPLNPTPDDVRDALAGSADARLQVFIAEPESYNAYREWAGRVKSSEGLTVAGTQAVKDSPFAWASFATDSAALLAKMPTDDDLKVEEFKPSPTAGSFDFTVSVKDVTIGDKASEDNLKKLFGLEGAESLDSAAFSSENVSLDFKEPQDGKLKFTATPAVDNAKSFFMKVKVK